ncbi:MAG: hypothetical protein ACOCXZ_00035 [Chloroflexota bacterium]
MIPAIYHHALAEGEAFSARPADAGAPVLTGFKPAVDDSCSAAAGSTQDSSQERSDQ